MRTDRLFLFLTLTSICLLSSCRQPPSPHSRPGTYTVRLNLSGDMSLRDQFLTELQKSFAGTNFEIVDSGEPDTTLSGELKARTEPRERGLSMFHQQFTANGEAKSTALCSAVYSNYEAATRDTKIFETDSPAAARELQILYPKAKTVYLDPAGSFQIAPPIAAAFTKALQEKGLAVTSTPDASVTDRVTLSLEKITTSGQTMRYKLSFDGPFDGLRLWGDSWLPGETQPTYPHDCRGPMLPLYGTDLPAVHNLTLEVVKALRTQHKNLGNSPTGANLTAMSPFGP